MRRVDVPDTKPDVLQWLAREHEIRVSQVDGVYQTDDPRDVQALIDAYDPLPDVRARLKQAVEKERQTRIDLLADDRTKFLSLAQFDELLYLESQLGELTVAQQNLRANLLGAWNMVSVIEAAAAAITADIDALPDVATALAFDPAASDRWPR